MSIDDRTQTAGTIRATGEASEQEPSTPVCLVCKSTKGGECEHCPDPTISVSAVDDRHPSTSTTRATARRRSCAVTWRLQP